MHVVIRVFPLALAFVLALAAPRAFAASPDVERALALGDAGDHAGALAIWTRLADAGDRLAMIEVGLAHHHGRGVPVDYPKALDWYVRADNGDALNNMGVMYRDGLGVPRDRRIAYLAFLIVHMAGMGSEATISRANRNLRREMAEQSPAELKAALCYPVAYFQAFLRARGSLDRGPEDFAVDEERPRFRDAGWWMPGEVGAFDCPYVEPAQAAAVTPDEAPRAAPTRR